MSGTNAGMTAEEFSGSLTGFEEIAIAKHFDLDIYGEAETRPMVAIRALVFTDQVRKGETAADAKTYAMSMAGKDAMAYFPDEDPDDPTVDAVGNDEGP